MRRHAGARHAGAGGMRGGSILLTTLAALSAATLLAIGAAAVLRASAARVADIAADAEGRRAAFDCIGRFAKEAILCDTNGYDAAGESWSLPFPPEDAPESAVAALAPEFPGIDPAPCVDEESRLPINHAPEDTLAALVAEVCGKDAIHAARIAGEIVALRPLPRREYMRLAPSLDGEAYLRLAPFVTAAPSKAVNINTASEPVLRAAFAVAERYGTAASKSLARKLIEYRRGGGALKSLEIAEAGAALGGLNQAEAAALSAMGEFLAVESRHFSGAATSGPALVVFTIDRESGKLARTVVAH